MSPAGRPPKQASERLSRAVAVRMTEAEYAALLALVQRQRAAVEATGVAVEITPSVVIRSLIRREANALDSSASARQRRKK